MVTFAQNRGSMIDKKIINNWNKQFKDRPSEELLRFFLKEYKGKIALSSSMSVEDQLLTEMVVNIDPEAKIFTLDTGRLFPETYDLIEKTETRYGIKIDVVFPDNRRVERMVKENGINLFYKSEEARRRCCDVRKLDPLKRALLSYDAWICGLRRAQAPTRENIETVMDDKRNGIIKINPLVNWSEKDVWDYIKKWDVPYNLLHDKGFPSIGCACCTRAVKEGEDVRAGRWWWESPEKKECGLHMVNGKLVRDNK